MSPTNSYHDRFGEPWPAIPMTPLSVTPDVEQAPWSDLDPKMPHGRLERVGLLRHGTVNGKASVAVVILLDDGTRVVAETTWALFNAAARALAASPVASEET